MKSTPNQLFSPNAQLLLDLVFHEAEDAFEHPLAALDEWRHLAIKHGLGPLVYHLALSNKHPNAAICRDKLKGVYMASVMTNTRLTATCNSLCKTLMDANIAVMPLKGCYLAQCIYGDSALRPMSDIDILVQPNNASKAYSLLSGNDGQMMQQRESDHHLPPININGHLLELHRFLFPTDVKFPIPTDDIWEHAIPTNHPYGGYIMQPDQQLVYVSLHTYYTMRRGGLRLSWFLYIKLLLEREQQLSPEGIAHWVDKWYANEPFSAVMSILGALMPMAQQSKIGRWVKPLNTHQQRKLATLIQSSEQQNTSQSYRLAWERLSSTPGWRNKLRWVLGDGKSLWSLPFRIIKYGYRTLTMVVYKMRDNSGW